MRLKGHDCSEAGKHFIAICGWNRERLFGEIANGRMGLNLTSLIACRANNEASVHKIGLRFMTGQL